MINDRNTRMELRFFIGDSLLTSEHLFKLQDILKQVAPSWSSGLHIYRRGLPNLQVDIGLPNALFNTVKSASIQRGPTYTQLVKTFGEGPFARVTGIVELRGSDRSVIIVVKTDEWIFAPLSGEWHFGNWITFQILGPRIEREDAVCWSQNVFELLCDRLSPIWATAHSVDEYSSKNISTANGGMAAIGIDVSRYLPGLYWLNFFGKVYCDLIGKERLLSCPSKETKELDAGILIKVGGHPTDWNTETYKHDEAEILKHLGTKYFFDRFGSNMNSVAPKFVFPVKDDREIIHAGPNE